MVHGTSSINEQIKYLISIDNKYICSWNLYMFTILFYGFLKESLNWFKY